MKVVAEHPKVKDTITKMGKAVEQLDTLAAGGIENLTARMPVLGAPTNELVETTKVPIFTFTFIANRIVS